MTRRLSPEMRMKRMVQVLSETGLPVYRVRSTADGEIIIDTTPPTSSATENYDMMDFSR